MSRQEMICYMVANTDQIFEDFAEASDENIIALYKWLVKFKAKQGVTHG